MVPMRPALKPGLLPVWRNRDTVQIGIDPRRAVALTGMRGAGGLLRLLDGSRDRLQVLAAAGDLGMDAAATDRVLTLLAAGGALDDFPVSTYGALPPGRRARLAPELATVSLARRDADGGARALARRQAACVRVHGESRAGLCIAGLLTAAGIGLVISTGPAAARPGEPASGPGRPATPGRPGRPAEPGIPGEPAMPGKSGEAAAPRKSGEAATPGKPGEPATPGKPGEPALPGEPGEPALPGTCGLAAGRRSPPPPTAAALPPRRPRDQRSRPRRRPELVILADSHRRDLPATLVRRLVPHLAVSASEAIGVVGPLVLPGRSACLRCLDLARAERDPAWPIILAQLAGRAGADPPACDTVLATMVAAQATAQALAFIDAGAEAAAATNGTLELVLPDWQWRRRSWRPHPQCGCGFPG